MQACEQCHAHQELDSEVKDYKEKNEIDHAKILTSLTWIKIIGGAWLVIVLSLYGIIQSIQEGQSKIKQDMTQIVRNGELLSDVVLKLDEQHEDYFKLKLDGESWRTKVENDIEELKRMPKPSP